MRHQRILLAAAAAALSLPAILPAQRLAANDVRPVVNTAVPALDTAITQLEEFLQRYPNSPLRPRALFQLGELLVRDADEQFAAQQRAAGAGGASAVKPDYSKAIARYEELVRRFPDFERIDAAQYTLGTLYTIDQRYADAARMFQSVATRDSSQFRSEALFRLGDALFELASKERGASRRGLFARAATAYDQATRTSTEQGDIYFLSLYKLGWSYYNQANQSDQEDYRRATEVFGRLVDAYDHLTPEQQARLGLRGEAIEYMAVAFTQVGGADAASRYFSAHGGTPYRATVMRRVAESLRDQGDFPGAVRAYGTFLSESPTDSFALAAQAQIVDIYQNRMLEPDSAQAARLRLVDMFAPGSEWARRNPSQADSAQALRDLALRQSAQQLLATAQKGDRSKYAPAAELYQRYLREFPTGDSAQAYNSYYAEALFGTGDYVRAGGEYAKAAYGYRNGDTTLAAGAGQNAIVAFDSALVANKTSAGAQDSLFSAVDRFVAAFPSSPLAQKALLLKGRRASETQRWDVMAETFRTYASRYPNDPFTPSAERLVGDALYRANKYAEAQTQWERAQQVATARGNRALADSISTVRTTAAQAYADTLVRRGDYGRAAEEVYVAYAHANPTNAKAPDALRNAIETYMMADSVARARGDDRASRDAREHAVAVAGELVQRYPNYQYRPQYDQLRARLLADLGKRDEAVQAYQALIASNTRWAGRADAMIRVATMLDSSGKKAEAAAAYAQFADAYPSDARAPDALYNAALTYVEAKDQRSAATTFARFAQRYPRDQRAGEASTRRIALLREAGDTAAVGAALASACENPTEDLRTECASRVAARAFDNGLATFAVYQPIKLTIQRRAQLTQAGVRAASARKQGLLRQLTAQMADAIRAGSPEYLAAATYYVGLAQWEYGNFLRDVELPTSLTEEQKAQARQGAAQQAEEFYTAAKQTWGELVEKAGSTPALRDNEEASQWVRRASEAVNGHVDSNPGGVRRR